MIAHGRTLVKLPNVALRKQKMHFIECIVDGWEADGRLDGSVEYESHPAREVGLEDRGASVPVPMVPSMLSIRFRKLSSCLKENDFRKRIFRYAP